MNQPRPRPLTIVFSSFHDAMDVNAFSTTIFHMAEALKAEIPDLQIVRFPRIFLHWKNVQRLLRIFPFIRLANRDFFLKFCAWRMARRFKGRRVVVINVVDSLLAIFGRAGASKSQEQAHSAARSLSQPCNARRARGLRRRRRQP